MRGNPTAALLLVLSEATSIADIPRSTLSPSFWLRAILLIKNSKPFVMRGQKAPQVKTTQVVSFLLAIKISHLLRIPKKQYVKALSAYLLSISWLSVLFSSCPTIFYIKQFLETQPGAVAGYCWYIFLEEYRCVFFIKLNMFRIMKYKKKKSVAQRLDNP